MCGFSLAIDYAVVLCRRQKGDGAVVRRLEVGFQAFSNVPQSDPVLGDGDGPGIHMAPAEGFVWSGAVGLRDSWVWAS